jgi:hypothetical protein
MERDSPVSPRCWRSVGRATVQDGKQNQQSSEHGLASSSLLTKRLIRTDAWQVERVKELVILVFRSPAAHEPANLPY